MLKGSVPTKLGNETKMTDHHHLTLSSSMQEHSKKRQRRRHFLLAGEMIAYMLSPATPLSKGLAPAGLLRVEPPRPG